MRIDPDVFERAADRIEKYGLCKHEYYPGWLDTQGDTLHIRTEAQKNVPVCTYGALCAEVPVTSKSSIADMVSWYGGYLQEIIKVDSIENWNDKPSQRKGRVVAALRKAAKAARDQE